jgi:hypothetical protein
MGYELLYALVKTDYTRDADRQTSDHIGLNTVASYPYQFEAASGKTRAVSPSQSANHHPPRRAKAK